MVLRLRYAALSDVGMVRQGNEDSALASPNLLVLADGMGGHAGGEVASAAAVLSLAGLATPADRGDPTEVIRRGIAAAGERLRALIVARPELEGMGTTLTLLLHSGDRIAIAQVGDSRGYLLRAGVLERVTQDQTFVQSLIDQGRISDDEAKTHPQRNLLLQALDGREDVEPVVVLRTPRPGDRYLLCSDGLSSVVSEPTLRDVLEVGTPTEAAHRLVDLAIRAGAPDNVTCLVADVVDEPDDVAPPATQLVGAVADTNASPAGLGTPAKTGDAAASTASTAGSAAEGRGQHRSDGDHRDQSAEGDEGDDGHDGDGKGHPRGVRLMLPVLLLLALAGVGAFVGYRWTQTQYYVGVTHGEVAIYRGVSQQVVGQSLSELVESTGVRASTLPTFSQNEVSDTISAASLVEARLIVDRLRTQSALCTGTTSPSSTPSSSSSGTPSGSPSGTPSGPAHSPTSTATTKPSTTSTPATTATASADTGPPDGCPPVLGSAPVASPSAGASLGSAAPGSVLLTPLASGSPVR